MSTPLRERPDAPLGTLIFRAGLLPAETIENALEEGVKTGRRLGEILIERGLIKEEDLTRLLAGQKGLPFINLREQPIDPEAARLLAEDQARLFTALPIGFEDNAVVVALADPTNDVLTRNVREAIGQEVRLVVAARSELNDMIGEVFSGALEAAPAAPEPEPEPQPLRVDTSVPPAGPELAVADVEPQPEPAAEPVAEAEPMVEAGPEVEPEPHFDASEYEFEAPAPQPEPEPEPAPEPEPEPEPAAVLEPVMEAPPEPPAPTYEAPAAPEPFAAPLATEPVAPQSVPQSNGHVPEDFEDDSPPPAPASGGAYRVSIRLTSGERVIVADCEDIGEAKGYAKALTKQLGATDSDDWPFVNGRFLKPDTIVSVDVEEL
jgi:Type II secretion system (T2SS), protein E, N-terminal domain